MHQTQEKILRLAHEKNLGQMTLREIGGYIGIASPQKVKHHLNQLEKRGLIRIDRIKGVIEKAQPGRIQGLLKDARLIMVPVLGTANCGPAQLFAESNIAGYLRVSSMILSRRSGRNLFALKASGPSMNRADVDGKTIDDGDYIIIDSQAQSPKDDDVILSIIDGMANIKRFHLDKENNQIVLASDSSYDFPPTCIHPDDDYHVNGTVIQIIKKPKRD